MKTPTPITPDQVRECFCQSGEGKEQSEYMLAISCAIEAARDAQWVEMLGKQEPVATLYSDGYWVPKKTEKGRLFNEQLGARKDVYTNPKPDDTALLLAENEVLREVLKEARKIIRASSSRNLAKDWDQRATTALKTRLNKKETT